MSDKEKKPEDETEDQKAEREAEADAKLNAAIKSHMARERKALEKLIADGQNKILEALKAQMPQPPAPEDKEQKAKPGDKEDPKVKLALEEIEKLKKSSAEAEERAKAAELRERTKTTDGELRNLLDAKGIRGARAGAVIALWKASDMIAYDEDGNAVLKVERARSKGAKAEALEFDLKSGVEDWAKTEEAAEFLPAPGGDRKTSTAGSRGAADTRRAGVRRETPALSDQEAVRRTAEDLERAGVDVNDLL